ncbi:MAG: carboxymuconolactone decarboxylase family protein [Pseudomonadota bacterium]
MIKKELPAAAGDIKEKHPDLWDAYAKLGGAAAASGPLDKKTQRLVKLGLAIGARSEGAVHSHTRRALAEGFSTNEIKHAALLAVTTLGFPQAVAALSWIEDITDSD